MANDDDLQLKTGPGFMQRLWNRDIAPMIEKRVPLIDVNWYRTPKGLKWKKPKPPDPDHPFKIKIGKLKNSRNYVMTVSWGTVTWPTYGESGESGAFIGLATAVVKMNGKPLNAKTPPVYTLAPDLFDDSKDIVVSMPFAWVLGTSSTGVPRDNNTSTADGHQHQVRSAPSWVNYQGEPQIEIADRGVTTVPGKMIWTIAEIGSEAGEFTQLRRSDIDAPSMEKDVVIDHSSGGGGGDAPGTPDGAQDPVFDQNPPTTEQAGPPWPVPVGPPPPTTPAQ